ncbi:hypothetical protein [Streptomyces sp. A0592]|uniref:hypothetical protein n=1 Tax=Streptomyces sp. A0592 TaxID=2563099 RepID=UPI00109EA4B6|nr:hypothetical protein [Streptomyces sp. A0592]THA84902.1 hypothetical protein E6U81_10900 [Streptomyces sp. A0592]
MGEPDAPRRWHRCGAPDASGIEGELMAVVNEDVSNSVHPHWMELAHIRGPSGREFSTAVDNIESAELHPGQRT